MDDDVIKLYFFIKNNIKEINIIEAKAIYEEITFRGYSKLDVKIEYLIKAIQRVLADGAVGANIDISDSAQKVSVQPIYNETETEIGKDEQIGVGVG